MPTPATLTQGQPYLGGTVQYDSATGRQLNAGETTLASPAPTTNPRLRDFSIALTKGQITNQADTNAFFGNTQSGASVPPAQSVTPQSPSNSPAPVDPLASLNPQQRSDFSKQFSIALSKGQLSDQTSVDKFKNDYAIGAQGGSSPTIASTQPKGTISNSGQSANVQNNIASSSGSTSSGYYPRGGASS